MMKDKVIYYTIVKKSDIKLNKDNSDTIKARIVLENMLNYLNVKLPEIYISKNGKPYFKNSNIYFNYSHSKNYIACAVSNYEVGIDIEESNRVINDKIAKKFLDEENNYKKRIEKWVKKEAYSKLKGKGLLIPFQTINLNKIKNKNLFISNDNYMCSIYSDNNDLIFKELILKINNN